MQERLKRQAEPFFKRNDKSTKNAEEAKNYYNHLFHPEDHRLAPLASLAQPHGSANAKYIHSLSPRQPQRAPGSPSGCVVSSRRTNISSRRVNTGRRWRNG